MPSQMREDARMMEMLHGILAKGRPLSRKEAELLAKQYCPVLLSAIQRYRDYADRVEEKRRG